MGFIDMCVDMCFYAVAVVWSCVHLKQSTRGIGPGIDTAASSHHCAQGWWPPSRNQATCPLCCFLQRVRVGRNKGSLLDPQRTPQWQAALPPEEGRTDVLHWQVDKRESSLGHPFSAQVSREEGHRGQAGKARTDFGPSSSCGSEASIPFLYAAQCMRTNTTHLWVWLPD